MTPEYLEKRIREIAPQLRDQLLRAFYAMAYPDGLPPDQIRNVLPKLDAAILAQDRAAILNQLGIAAEGTSWPALDDQIEFVLNDELLPLFSYVRHDAFRDLAENSDDFAIDKTDYRDALTQARQTIVSETLAGTLAAITFIMKSPKVFSGVNLIASIGLTGRQVQFYLAGVRKALKVQREIGKNADDIERQVAALHAELKGVPEIIARAIRTIMRENRSLSEFSNDDTRRFSKNLAKSMQHYRANALSRLLVATVSTTTELSVWKQAQRLGAVGSDARKYWQTQHDDRVRHDHAETEAMNAGGVALEDQFKTPLGPVNGPPLENGCRCVCVLGSSSGAKVSPARPSLSSGASA